MTAANTEARRRTVVQRLMCAACALALASACSSLRGTLDLADDGDDIRSLPAAEEPAPQGAGTVPLDDGADWIQLKSGEWLRGKVVRIRDGKLDFDSDVLDDQTFPLADLKVVRTAGSQVIVTKGAQTLQGKIVTEGSKVWIEGERTVRIDRDDILAALSFEGARPVDWRGSVTFGATTRSGNTSQNDTTAFAELVRETARTRWRSSYNGALGRAQGTETANNHRLRSVYDVAMTERLFVTVPSVDAYRDRFQNLEYRITAAVFLGYELVDTAAHDWRVSVGPAYQATRFFTTNVGTESTDDTVAAAAVSNYSWDVTRDVDLSLDYSITAPLPETSEYNHNLVLKLSVDLVGDLQLDVAFVWDRVNRPIANGSGEVPLQDDYRTTIGLGWTF